MAAALLAGDKLERILKDISPYESFCKKYKV